MLSCHAQGNIQVKMDQQLNRFDSQRNNSVRLSADTPLSFRIKQRSMYHIVYVMVGGMLPSC